MRQLLLCLPEARSGDWETDSGHRFKTL